MTNSIETGALAPGVVVDGGGEVALIDVMLPCPPPPSGPMANPITRPTAAVKATSASPSLSFGLI